MPKVWNIQSNFSSGELDPKLLGRIDLSVYYNALKRARNVTPQVQGGVSWRNGSEFIDTIEFPSVRLFSFSFSTEDNYLLVFGAFRMFIYKDGDDLQTNINGLGLDYLQLPYTEDQISELDIIQSLDTIIITHPLLDPRVIVRETDTTWDSSLAPLVNHPQYDFNDASSPTPVAAVQTVTFVNANTSDRYKLSLEGILTEEIVFAATGATNAENIQAALQDLPNTGNTGVSVAPVSLLSYTVTLADDSADEYKLITGTAIDSQVTTFEVSAVEVTPGVSRKEDVWSTGRGWPKTCTFHEGRLYFGGSNSRAQTLWGSVKGDFFNFDAGKARDDQAIDVTLDTDQLNAIQGIFSNRTLQIFTTGSEFFVPTSPITPSNVAIAPQSNFGSKSVRPISIDGKTIYLQRTGKAIREFSQAADVENIYNSASISLLASHIVVDPIRMAASTGSAEVDANYAYFVNSDGTLLVYNALGAESVVGFTLWNMEGGHEILDVAVVNDEVFLLVNDPLANAPFGETRIIRMKSDRVTDLSVQKTSLLSGIFTGLDHLEGRTVQVIRDGAFISEEVVTGGQVTVPEGIISIVEVGLEFTPLIETMPLNVPLQNGPNFSEPKKINRITVDYFESLGLIVKNSLGQQARIADKTMGIDSFSNPTPHSGRSDIWLLGWDNVATVTVTRDTPVQATILTIGVEVGV